MMCSLLKKNCLLEHVLERVAYPTREINDSWHSRGRKCSWESTFSTPVGPALGFGSQNWKNAEEWFYLSFIQGDEEIKSDIYTLFFHIVQRIPEYLIHLQVGMAGQAPKVIFRLNYCFLLPRNTVRDQEGIINISKIYLNNLRVLMTFPPPTLWYELKSQSLKMFGSWCLPLMFYLNLLTISTSADPGSFYSSSYWTLTTYSVPPTSVPQPSKCIP